MIQPTKKAKENKANGGPPVVEVDRGDYEALYNKCWETSAYRLYSPGERLVNDFIEAAKPYKTQTVIDWGCGTGRGGYRLYKEHELNVTLVDFAENCLDESVREEAKDNENLRFVKLDLTQPIDPQQLENTSQFGFCTDVLEHIPEEDIDAVIDNILTHSMHVFFQISCSEDHFGAHPNIQGDKDEPEHLHVCVHPYQWWLEKFVKYGVEIHRSADLANACLFYVTAYTGHHFESLKGAVNVPTETLLENIEHSATLGLPSIRPYQAQDIEIMLVAGGPTTLDFKEEIIQQREDGMKLVTVNGAYNLVQDWGLKPSLQFLLDSRGFNKRFVEQSELTDETKFVISSSADPEVFEIVPKDRTIIFHTCVSDEIMPTIEKHYGKEFEEVFPIPGGCTVTLRAIAALRMLGFYKIHIYGFDGCIFDDRYHHAYEQSENDEDAERALPMIVAAGSKWEKKFMVAPWMIFQAMDFRKMCIRLLPDVLLDIKGDGLIAYMIQCAAELGGDVDVEIDATAVPGRRAYIGTGGYSRKANRPGQCDAREVLIKNENGELVAETRIQ